MRHVIWSIALGLPLCGIGCAGAPDSSDEGPADLNGVREAIAARPSGTPPPITADPDPRTAGVGGNAQRFDTVQPVGSSRTPGTVSRASVFGRPSGNTPDGRPPPSTFPTPPDPSARFAGADAAPAAAAVPTPTGAVQQVGFLRRLLGSSASASPASPSAASPSPNTSSSSLRSSERQRLHEKLLFYPTKYPDGIWTPEAFGAEDVAFTASDGTRLHGWYLPCESPQAYMLYAHGNGGNLSYNGEVYRKLRELHVAVLAFDYRGYGRSAGKPTIAGVLDDARSARAWLARRAAVPERQIVLMGRSLGGAVVVQLAGEMPPRGLVLESTFSSLREIADHHFSKLSWLVPRDELNSIAVLAAYRGRLFASHGDADRTIPPEQGKKLYEAARGPKQFFKIAGGDHNDPPPDEYYRRLDRFLAELPTGNSAAEGDGEK